MVALGACLTLSGCELPGSRGGLKGHRPAQSGPVASVSLPEVRAGSPDRPFFFRAPRGSLLYVYFGYASCPDVCPATLSDLRKALKLLGPDSNRVEVALVTVDSERDTGDLLLRYLDSFVRGGHALRPETQEQLGRAETAFGATSRVGRGTGGKIEVSHTAVSYLVDEAGQILVEWDFGAKPADIASDLRALLAVRGQMPR